MGFHEDLVGADLHISKTLTGSGPPVGVVTPNVNGLLYVDLSTSPASLWVSNGLTNVDWQLINGSPGPGGQELVGVAQFAYNTASPLSLIILQANDYINLVEVSVTTVFDDPAATIEIGTVASPGLVFATNETDITALGQFSNGQNYFISGPELLRLTINPGTSTQGAGFILFSIRR